VALFLAKRRITEYPPLTYRPLPRLDSHIAINPDIFSGGRISARLREEMVILMKREFRERECIHQDDGVEGAFYNGVFYLQALQRLPVDAAVRMSSKVSSFFWADAPHILVWLCQDCAAELRLTDTPRAVTQHTRRQA
jgi:hypothetical protein